MAFDGNVSHVEHSFLDFVHGQKVRVPNLNVKVVWFLFPIIALLPQ